MIPLIFTQAGALYQLAHQRWAFWKGRDLEHALRGTVPKWHFLSKSVPSWGWVLPPKPSVCQLFSAHLVRHECSLLKRGLHRNLHILTCGHCADEGNQDLALANMVGGNVFFTVLLPGKIIQVVCESPVEVRRSQEVDSALETVDLNEEAEATPGPPERKLKREERKPPTNSLMAFLRQMVSHSLLVQANLNTLHSFRG